MWIFHLFNGSFGHEQEFDDGHVEDVRDAQKPEQNHGRGKIVEPAKFLQKKSYQFWTNLQLLLEFITATELQK